MTSGRRGVSRAGRSSLRRGAGRAPRRRSRRAPLPARESFGTGRASAARHTRHAPASSGSAACSRGGRPAAPLRSGVFQRTRRVRRQRPRVRHHPGGAPGHSRALGQRRREPVLRLPRLRVGIRIHVGPQQPVQPAHALVQRSGERSARRSGLRPRRENRRDLVSHRPADSRRMALCRASRPGLHPLRARKPRNRPGASAIRSTRGPRQDLEAHAREPLADGAPAFRDHVRRVGPRCRSRGVRALRRDRAGPGHGSPARAQPLERTVRKFGRLHGPGRPPVRLDRGPYRISRTKWEPGRSRRTRSRDLVVRPNRGGARPVLRSANGRRSRSRRAQRSSLPVGPGQRRRPRARSRPAVSRRGPGCCPRLGPPVLGRRSRRPPGLHARTVRWT